MKTPESWEKDELKKYLTEIGAFYFLTFAPGFGKSGLPDIVACVSRSSEKLSDAFIHWLEKQVAGYSYESIDQIRDAFNEGYRLGRRTIGAFWAIEVKREGFDPTELQKTRMAEVEKAGGKTAGGTAEKVREEIETWRKNR